MHGIAQVLLLKPLVCMRNISMTCTSFVFDGMKCMHEIANVVSQIKQPLSSSLSTFFFFFFAGIKFCFPTHFGLRTYGEGHFDKMLAVEPVKQSCFDMISSCKFGVPGQVSDFFIWSALICGLQYSSVRRTRWLITLLNTIN